MAKITIIYIIENKAQRQNNYGVLLNHFQLVYLINLDYNYQIMSLSGMHCLTDQLLFMQ